MPAPRPAIGHFAAIGLSTINGLPAHVLLVHAVVVLVPMSAVALVAALKPTVATRFGIWLPVLAAVAFGSVLAAMNAGGWLENHVRDDRLVRDHTQMAGQLWPFSLAVLVLSVVVWRTSSRVTRPGRAAADVESGTPSAGGTATAVILAVLAVLVAVGSVVEVVRIGDSGSRASWHNHFSQGSVGAAGHSG